MANFKNLGIQPIDTSQKVLIYKNDSLKVGKVISEKNRPMLNIGRLRMQVLIKNVPINAVVY